MVTAAYLPFLTRSQLARPGRVQNQMSFETLQSHSSHYSWSHTKTQSPAVSLSYFNPQCICITSASTKLPFLHFLQQNWLHNLWGPMQD